MMLFFNISKLNSYQLSHLRFIVFYFSRLGISMLCCVSIYHACKCSMVCGIQHANPPHAIWREKRDSLQEPRFSFLIFPSSNITSKDLHIKKIFIQSNLWSLIIICLTKKISHINYNEMAGYHSRQIVVWLV